MSSITLSNSEKLTFIMNLATMLSAGIALVEAIDSLLEDAKGNQKKLLVSLREDIMQGNQMHVALAKFPNIFDKVNVNIIKASEQAGTLDTTLRDIKNNIQKETEFVDQIRSALLYPIVILVVFIGVLLMILIVVIPKISLVFANLHTTLPLPTKILIFISSTLLNYTIPVIVGLVLFIGIFVFLLKTRRKELLRLLFKLPVISGVIQKIDLARFSRSLYLLLQAGITIVAALELTQEVVIKKELEKAIKSSREMVLSGKRFSEGLKTSKDKIPSVMIKIIEAGEKTGSLDKSMQEVSEYFEYEVSGTLKTLTALLEPVMLVFVGVLVGGMMLAIIAPIYGLIGQVGGR